MLMTEPRSRRLCNLTRLTCLALKWNSVAHWLRFWRWSLHQSWVRSMELATVQAGKNCALHPAHIKLSATTMQTASEKLLLQALIHFWNSEPSSQYNNKVILQWGHSSNISGAYTDMQIESPKVAVSSTVMEASSLDLDLTSLKCRGLLRSFRRKRPWRQACSMQWLSLVAGRGWRLADTCGSPRHPQQAAYEHRPCRI